MYAIEIRNLTKRYGRRIALEKVSLSIDSGAVLGLVGPVGAGKTTLLRILATVLQPSAGDVFIDTISIKQHPQQIRQLIGYMPSVLGPINDMTASEYLEFYAACYNVPEADRPALSNDLLQLVDLYHRRNDPLDRLSIGMKKRLELARTLVHDPQVMLLDEPFTGLDPRARVETRELINELRSLGKTIIITSPLLAEVEAICTHIAFLNNGKINFWGSSNDVNIHFADHHLPHRIVGIRFLGDADRAIAIATEAAGVSDVRPIQPYAAAMASAALPAQTTLNLLKEMHLSFTGDYTAASNLLRKLMHSGTQVVSFNELSTPLPPVKNATHSPPSIMPPISGEDDIKPVAETIEAATTPNENAHL